MTEIFRKVWWRERRYDAAAVGLIILFFLLFFARAFINHRFILTGDSFYYTYPLRSVAWSMLKTGQLPTWTPLILSGFPLMSEAQLALGYPLTWLYLFLPGPWAEQIYVLAPFIVSPIATYSYSRQLGRSIHASVLAGLSFGYGGMMCGILANSGLLTNSFCWAPVALLFIDRAQTKSFRHCLLWTTIAYTLSVLAGHGQSFTYVAALCLAYSLFLSIKRRNSHSAWWRPFGVATGAILLSAGVGAFQILQTLTTLRLSVRRFLTYEVFSEGSFSLREAILSMGAQPFHFIDSSTYVPPLTVVLVLTALALTLRGHINDSRIWFWVLIAILSFCLLLGSNTSLNKLVYHIPLWNKFRVQSRHTFEWTLALSIVGAYGWDATISYFKKQNQTRDKTRDVLSIVLLLAAGIVGWLWWRRVIPSPETNPSGLIRQGMTENSYWIWKLTFTTFVLLIGWTSLRWPLSVLRKMGLGAVIAFSCFVEANATASSWWLDSLSLPPSRFEALSDTTSFLKALPAGQNRIFTRVGMYADEFHNPPRLDGPNLTMLHGLHNVAGLEPLILERYSKALGNVSLDSVTPTDRRSATEELLNIRSHVLDLLNTTHVVTYSGTLGIYPEQYIEHEGEKLSVADLNVNLKPGESTRMRADGQTADKLILVTSLANAVDEVQQATVAKVVVFTNDNSTVELPLRAGIDTAEWAHERPDVRAVIKHQLAPVFDSHPNDSTFVANRYWTKLLLPRASSIAAIEITNVAPDATLTIWKASIGNTSDANSSSLTVNQRSKFWSTIYSKDGVEIVRNSRALPQAWLVGEELSVDETEALKRIRGESAIDFDPTKTVLLEIPDGSIPTLSGNRTNAANLVEVTNYEPNRLIIQTKSQTPNILVVSEPSFPGWEAYVDGNRTPILVADYLLRGIALPAGSHTIEMRYTPPALRSGAIITLAALSFIGVLALLKYHIPKRG